MQWSPDIDLDKVYITAANFGGPIGILTQYFSFILNK